MIKIAIIEDKRQTREGLAALINGTEGFRCTGTFDSMEEALTKVNSQNADLVLVDIGSPGIEQMRSFKESHPNLMLLVLSVYEDDGRIFEALCAGASGYLLKKTSSALLLEGLRDALNGGALISPEIAMRVITFFSEIRSPQNAQYQLNPQEMRLLKLLAEGHNQKTAAAELGIGVNMISFHLKKIYEKLQDHPKSEAVAKALRNRLI